MGVTVTFGDNIKGKITIKKHVRLFVRVKPESNRLAHDEVDWVMKDETIRLGEPKKMSFDHRDHQVAQVLDLEEERFIILSELDENPWHLVPPQAPTEQKPACENTAVPEILIPDTVRSMLAGVIARGGKVSSISVMYGEPVTRNISFGHIEMDMKKGEHNWLVKH